MVSARRPDATGCVAVTVADSQHQVVIIGSLSLFSVIYNNFSSSMFSIPSIHSNDDDNQHSRNGNFVFKLFGWIPAAAVISAPPPSKRELTFNPASCL
jgi:hypothetical protein